MSDQSNEIEKLIRLKRYEQPPEGYFDDFLTEFQSRQRSEMLHHSARSLFFERVGTYFSGFSKRHWIYAGSAAYAAVTLGFFLITGMGATSGDSPATPGTLSIASNEAVTSSSVGTDEEKHVLWDETKIILVEDDTNQQIANRRHLMSVDAEWDPTILPTSARGSDINIVPGKSNEDTKQEQPATPPAGLAL